MAKFRFLALQEIARRKPVDGGERPRCSVVFGENVFSLDKMRHYLSIEAYKKLEKAMLEGLAIDRGLADQVAAAMKAWAVERGVTHYTHWFHPLNGATAEKHDSFIDLLPSGDVIESFDGRLLVQQEPVSRTGGFATRSRLAVTRPGTRRPRRSSITGRCVFPRFSWPTRERLSISRLRC